ncbi:MAG: AAA family ATPase [Caldilineaceae bacterium]|nr:AAA family ATPase [Caldilineaceae bacterium]
MKADLRFHFSNVGPVDDAKLELGDLTVIAGRNNTGKTYLVYTLYGFLKEYHNLKRAIIGSPTLDTHLREVTSLTVSEFEEKLLAEGRLEWENDRDALALLHTQLFQEMCRRFSETGFSEVFNTSSDFFKDAALKVDFSSDFSGTGAFGIPIERSVLWCKFEGEKIELELQRLEPERKLEVEPGEIFNRAMYTYLDAIFQVPYTLLGRPVHILSSARHSISLFFRELDRARSQVVRSLQQMKDDHGEASPRISELLRQQTSRYPLPIQDNIDFARELPVLDPKAENEDLRHALENIIGGRLEVQDDDVRFISSKGDTRSIDIPLHLASSSVWEMTNLFFFLGLLERRGGHFLIIDEPESHLDTANQIQFTRLLARLVNAGTKVLITTHSDYIIKEINNLVMLSGDFEGKEEVSKRLGYQQDDEISPDQIRAYTAERGTLRRCDVRDIGIDMPVFDDTIRSINMTARELFALTRKNTESGDEI